MAIIDENYCQKPFLRALSNSQLSGNYCQKPFLRALSKRQLGVFQVWGNLGPYQKLIYGCMHACMLIYLTCFFEGAAGAHRSRRSLEGVTICCALLISNAGFYSSRRSLKGGNYLLCPSFLFDDAQDEGIIWCTDCSSLGCV